MRLRRTLRLYSDVKFLFDDTALLVDISKNLVRIVQTVLPESASTLANFNEIGWVWTSFIGRIVLWTLSGSGTTHLGHYLSSTLSDLGIVRFGHHPQDLSDFEM